MHKIYLHKEACSVRDEKNEEIHVGNVYYVLNLKYYLRLCCRYRVQPRTELVYVST